MNVSGELPSVAMSSRVLSATQRRLRDHVERFSVKRGDFVLKSGARSSWFLDTKQTACRPEGIVAVADALEHAVGDMSKMYLKE